ncbi:hypothetical protein AMTRI_Chr10g3860 [Amborella trichopoda]|uniref:Germin-like protein n=1 Tax=Amborella trichopoda TaxID=13333 RepID=W1NQ42_AMBTC|nr:germin-like protein subfamily 1 member 1 [Amborella trichopoda]ERM96894.1 hypothetical protein AMTR_s00074p00061830 [Amborella trichopoda]|eukprot:XP_006829478.3 germin-like protein subfamily 1 member 1 [Amborella trichopoda]
MGCRLLLLIFLAMATRRAKCSDPDPLQDFCIADTANPYGLFLNGQPCINPARAEPSHFKTSALASPGNTRANPFGFNVTLTSTKNLPGCHTQSLALARIDIDVGGTVPPHAHPRASEVTFIVRGVLLVGFVDTSNRLYTQQLLPGDTFMFPRALVHFLYNIGSTPALAISGLSSQNPGAQLSSLATFTTKPAMPDEVLKKAFQITGQDVQRMRKNLGG